MSRGLKPPDFGPRLGQGTASAGQTGYRKAVTRTRRDGTVVILTRGDAYHEPEELLVSVICAECGERVEVDDAVQELTDDGAGRWVHANVDECRGRYANLHVLAGTLGPLQVRTSVCPDCHYERAVSGACGC